MKILIETRSPENSSLLHPVYKQVIGEKEILCADVKKIGNCWYAINYGGHIVTGVEPERIKEVRTNSGLLFNVHFDHTGYLQGKKFCCEVYRNPNNGYGSCYCTLDGIMDYIHQEERFEARLSQS